MTGDPLDFLVLTGFLGSGKTTLLRDFLKAQAAPDTAVIVNEVGEIALDGVVLREGGDEFPMATLSNGCVCCQLGSDLAFTIEGLITARRGGGAGPLRRIILETSGLAKPGPVLRTVASLAGHRMRVAVVGTFDPTRGTEIAGFEEAVSQWAAAHRIVATKTDMVSTSEIADAAAAIAAINPLSEVIATADRASAVGAAFAPLAASVRLREPDLNRPSAHPRIALCLARPVGEVAYGDLATWLDNLAGALGERLLRIKGLVGVTESPDPLLIESVGTLFSPPRALHVTTRSSFIVIIARDVVNSELDLVSPSGLFHLSRWQRPASASQGDRRTMTAEWVE